MKKSMFRACLLLAGLTLGFYSLHAAIGQKDVKYTVVEVFGTVTLDDKPLVPGCKTNKCVGVVYGAQIPKIKMGKNSYVVLSGRSGKKYYYGASQCVQMTCPPVAVVITENVGPKMKLLLGTQADLDAITTILNKAKMEHIQPKELNTNKKQELPKNNAPQQQQLDKTKQVQKAKTGGGR